MNCSIVYCFTTRASAGFVFLGSGVCLVSRALFDTSGFRSSRGFWAHPGENARAVSTEITDSNVTFFEFMAFVWDSLIASATDEGETFRAPRASSSGQSAFRGVHSAVGGHK